MTLWHDLKYALRGMIRTPGFTSVLMLTLAIGIGANTAMFSILNAALIRPLPFEDPDRLVYGFSRFEDSGETGWVSAPDYFDYRDQSEVFTSLAAFRGYEMESTITGGENPERIPSMEVSVDFFPTLGVSPHVGRNFVSEEADPGASPVAIISYRYWQRRFGGSREDVGSVVNIDGQPVSIVGVMPPHFHFQSECDLWRPMTDDPGAHLPRRFHNWYLVGRLKPGVTRAKAQSQMDVISKRLQVQYPDSNRDKTLELMGLHAALVYSDRANLLALMGAVALVLLIACANAAGLLLARGFTRRPEFALRVALGSSRGRLVRQLLTESFALTSVAVCLGLLLAAWVQPLLLKVTPLESLGLREIEMGSHVLMFAFVAAGVTALLAGLVPALSGGRANPAEELKSGTRTTEAKADTGLRSLLVAGQVALSIVLLTDSGLVIRSLMHLNGVDLGFNAKNLITAEIELPDSDYPEPDQKIQFFSSLVERARSLPGVEDASLINLLPIREPRNDTTLWPEDNPPADDASAGGAFIRTVMPGYFQAMGIPLTAGRLFDENDRRDAPPVVVINETLSRTIFPHRSPIGRKVVIDNPDGPLFTAEVIGVVGDVRMEGSGIAPGSAFYGSYPQAPYRVMQLAVRTSGDPEQLVPGLRTVVRDLDRNIPLADVATMEHLIGRSFSDHRTVAILLTTFSLVAVSLAALGLYGVLAFYVAQHTHEIGVRMALGAEDSQVIKMIVRRGMSVVLIGLAIGLAGSFAASRLIQHLLFGIPSSDMTTFVGAGFVFVVVALAACSLPAWKAMQVDPATSLRAE